MDEDRVTFGSIVPEGWEPREQKLEGLLLEALELLGDFADEDDFRERCAKAGVVLAAPGPVDPFEGL